MTIIVKIIRMPAGTVQEVAVNDGGTVADALTVAGVTQSANETITVNAVSATTTTVLKENDRIILAMASKGA